MRLYVSSQVEAVVHRAAEILLAAEIPLCRLYRDVSEENPTERPETDIIGLPLTHEELLVVMRCLVIASESELIDDADRERARTVKGRIARFAERQGAWWDHP